MQQTVRVLPSDLLVGPFNSLVRTLLHDVGARSQLETKRAAIQLIAALFFAENRSSYDPGFKSLSEVADELGVSVVSNGFRGEKFAFQPLDSPTNEGFGRGLI
jgi:hypothetical protein